jgi:vacuolar protein sorting-associated protein 26
LNFGKSVWPTSLFAGQIELYYDRGNHHEFLSRTNELARPGDLIQNTGYPFEFANVEKPYEVYVGSNVRLRYFLRVTIVRRLSDVIREIDIAVHTLYTYPDVNSPIKMEVGIEDCLHIEFEYNKSKYHLKDVIVGKIYFLLVRIKIKHMEIAIIKRETTGSGPNIFNENETIAKYEIMDGAPVRGESIPIRVFLAGYDLTPTMRDVNKKFSVKYFLNLVLMDTEDRRYFKQQEITLWRKSEKSRKSLSSGVPGAEGGTASGSAGQQSNYYNPHIPSHLMGQDSSLVNKQLAANAEAEAAAANAGAVAGGGDPTVGLFTQESPQQEVAPSAGHSQSTKQQQNAFTFGEEDEGENGQTGEELDRRDSKSAARQSNNSLLESQPPPLPDDRPDDIPDDSNDSFIPTPEPRRTLTTAERESGDGAAANSQLSFDETSSLFDSSEQPPPIEDLTISSKATAEKVEEAAPVAAAATTDN